MTTFRTFLFYPDERGGVEDAKEILLKSEGIREKVLSSFGVCLKLLILQSLGRGIDHRKYCLKFKFSTSQTKCF